MAHIMLVEDDTRLAALTAEYLTERGYTVDIIDSGTHAAKRILAEPPDLVILDVMLPGESGLSVLKTIREDYRGSVLMLTARGDDVDELLGFELGADDYVAKPVRPRLLLARVEALLRRTAHRSSTIPSERVEDGDFIVDRARREVTIRGIDVPMTTAEFDLLWFMVTRPGQPVTRDDLFRELRGIQYDGLDRSMDVRMSQLRKKLALTEAPERIITVRGVGYQFRPSA
ncbi:MAG: DNA-binding response OmpR family regulator [Myxococcota bacterium]|jgi:DNA-binding response OmpR family regulator